MINAHSKNSKEAVGFVEFLTEYIAKQSYINSQDIPLWQVDGEIKAKNPIFKQITDLANGSTNSIAGWDVFLDEKNRDIYWNNLYALFTGSITPEEFYKSLPGNE